MNCCDIFEKFDEKNNLIKEYKHWKLLVRKKQVKLGSCVAITKRHMSSFSDITDNEMKEYAQVVRDVEKALKESFNYDVIHHLMLMFFDKHTHFHIIPRYEKPRNFAEIEWNDDWNPNPLIQQREPVSQEVLNKIKKEIIKSLS